MRDVTDWDPVAKSTGTREGYWLRDLSGSEKRRALVKLPRKHHLRGRSFTRSEAWAEAVAAGVGKTLGLPVPEVEVVTFHGEECPLIWDFIPPGYELREGAVLTNSLPDQRWVAAEEARDRLAEYLGPSDATRHVIHMACFDILVGNPDRHQRNWGVLVASQRDTSPRMAPYYDNASALGSSLDPVKLRSLLEGGWREFDSGFRYEMAAAGKTRPRMDDLLRLFRAWDGSLASFQDKLSSLDDYVIEQIIAGIDSRVVTDEGREFGRRLLGHRRDYLRGAG